MKKFVFVLMLCLIVINFSTLTFAQGTSQAPDPNTPAQKEWKDMDGAERADAIVAEVPKLISKKTVELNGPAHRSLKAADASNKKLAEDAVTKSGEALKAIKAAEAILVNNLAMDIYIAKGYKSEEWPKAVGEAEGLLMQETSTTSSPRAKILEIKRAAYMTGLAEAFGKIPLQKVNAKEEVTRQDGTKVAMDFERDETPQEAMARVLSKLATAGTEQVVVKGKTEDSPVYATKAELDAEIAARKSADAELEAKIPTCQELADDIAAIIAAKGYLTKAQADDLYGCKNQTDQAIKDSKDALDIAKSVKDVAESTHQDVLILGEAVSKTVLAGGKGRDEKKIQEAKKALEDLYNKYNTPAGEKK